MIWLLAALASAHPFGGRYAAHELRLSVRDDEVTLEYRAEVPGVLAPDPQALARELTAGLVIIADGRALPAAPTRPPEIEAGSDHTVKVDVLLAAPLPPDVHRIEASNGSLPDVPAYHAVLATVSPRWAVTGCSLWTDHGDENGQWALDQTHRRVVVDLARTWVPTRSGQVPVGDARDRGGWVIGVGLGMVGLGLGGWWRLRRR